MFALGTLFGDQFVNRGQTPIYKLAAHLMILKNLCRWCLVVFLIAELPFPCLADELEPRLWSHLPVETNFVGGGYGYSTADIFFDPVLKLENVEMELQTWAVKYIRTFALFDRSARIDFTQGFQEGKWDGLVDSVPTSIKRSGLSDSFLRFAINLYGAPPLKGKEYAAYRANSDVETLVGMALAVQLPTGNYMDDKLINLGKNRFTFRPQLGVVHKRGKWSVEVTGAAWIYTDNDDFFNGNKLAQDPLYTLHAHLIHTFRPGIWAGASIGYGYGAESTLNGVDKHDRKGDLAWALNLGFPITRQLGVKVAYVGTRTQESVGFDSDSIIGTFSLFW